MTYTEFEEPEYEGPLYNQLLNGNLRIWTPGRVFERIIGIDSAVFANHEYFWSLFGHSNPIDGVSLRNYDWRFLWRFIQRRFRPFPSYSVNLLIQSKRPDYRKGINADYAKRGINGEYWQFNTKKHQQAILEQLETKLGTNALVVYACPVFHKFYDLDNYISQGQIIENSTFVKPSVLTNHKKWVFNTPGTTGLACSEIEYHKDIPFEEMIKNIKDNTKQKKDFHENINHLVEIINKILQKEDGNPLINAYKRRNKNLLEFIETEAKRFKDEDEKNFNYLIKYLSIGQFFSTINVEWFSIE